MAKRKRTVIEDVNILRVTTIYTTGVEETNYKFVVGEETLFEVDNLKDIVEAIERSKEPSALQLFPCGR